MDVDLDISTWARPPGDAGLSNDGDSREILESFQKLDDFLWVFAKTGISFRGPCLVITAESLGATS
jgi:hypothetical protein